MTNQQPHPEQEYIVLEHELSNIERYPYDPVTRQVTFKAIRSRLHSDSDNTSDKVLEDIVGIMERYPTDTYYKDCLRELREKIAEGARTMTRELHRHCQCDYCTGDDCKDLPSPTSVKSSEKELELLRKLEWSGNHTDYEDSWGVITIACPSCRNARKDGHKENCKLSAELRQRGDKK